jgi:hypothetical protein
MRFPPEAFIIGAQKAGTTSLATLLGAQPGILLANPKEPRFFTRNYERGMAWYQSCFAGAEDQILIDATPGYSAAPTERFPLLAAEAPDPTHEAARRIFETSPDARFIYLVRDPAARSYSAYWHNVRDGWEKRALHQAIAEDPAYSRMSDYAGQIANYLRFFPPERMLVVSFEAFVREPEIIARACCEHFGAHFSAMPEQAHRNKSFQFSGRGALLLRLAGSTHNLKRMVKVGRALIPRPVQTLLEKWLTNEIPGMSAADRLRLQEPHLGWEARLAALDGVRWIRLDADAKTSQTAP